MDTRAVAPPEVAESRGDAVELAGIGGPANLVVTPATLGRTIGSMLYTGGDIIRFSATTLRSMPRLRRYRTEVWRQAAGLVISSALILWMIQFVAGCSCGLEGSYVLRQIGAPLYSGMFSAWCAIREMSPYLFAYILAAKVGCGVVAELGSMRINEEIDALEVIGVDSRAYLVASRLVATWLAVPFMFLIGLGIMYLAEWLIVVGLLQEVSPGGYRYIFWLFQQPADLFYSLAKVMTMATVIVMVGCYFGYHARGGPAGVGMATAKSMMLNMVLIHVVGMLGTQLFWGLSSRVTPIAN
ncbi:MAG: ABC transporter permease [Actinomycetota bacterium]